VCELHLRLQTIEVGVEVGGGSGGGVGQERIEWKSEGIN
jgi:hypothetical protein